MLGSLQARIWPSDWRLRSIWQSKSTLIARATVQRCSLLLSRHGKTCCLVLQWSCRISWEGVQLIVQQTRVENYLNDLRLETFLTSGSDTAAALAQVYKRISSMSRQVPESHQGDAKKIKFLIQANFRYVASSAGIASRWRKKIKFLRHTLVGYASAKELLIRVATTGLSFQQLYAELGIAVQLERESAVAAASMKAFNSKIIGQETIPRIY